MEDAKQILFGGISILPLKEAILEKPKLDTRHRTVEILEQAFIKLTSTDDGKRLYGDPDKGATIEQAWRTSGLFTGKLPVCLLSTEQPPVETDAIDRVIKMSSKKLVDTLIEMSTLGKVMSYIILFHDGNLGHCITLIKYNKNTMRFTYVDPWPNYSLLCKDYNAAGINAQREDKCWSITTDELERVIFAAFVGRSLWSEYMAEKYYMTYDEFADTDFCKFFHVTEAFRGKQDDNSNTLIVLKTAAFQTEIDLSITLNEKNRLVDGMLNLKRSWLIGSPHGFNLLALDIARSFIAALTPPPDQEAIADLVSMLHQIQDPTYAEQLVNEGVEKSNLHRALFTYLGVLPYVKISFPFSDISMNNAAFDGEDWLQIQITTDTL